MKNAPLLVLVGAVILAAGYGLGALRAVVPTAADEAIDATASATPIVAETPATATLSIAQESAFLDGAPVGHIITFKGYLDQEVLLTQEIRPGYGIPDWEAPTEGSTIHSQGFYFAGIDDTLHYVRSASALEIQREVTPEFGEPQARERLMVIEIPADVEITFVPPLAGDHD